MAEFYSEGCVRLARHLATAKLEQKDFAEAVEIGPDFLSHLLRGRKRPSLDTAVRIEEASDGAVPTKSWTIEAEPDT
jgi:plasmid maintenance system antidote protein VapI